MTRKRIAVLGSGLSAVGVASAFIDSADSFDVEIIDFGIRDSKNVDSELSINKRKSSAKEYLFSIPEIFSMTSVDGALLGSAAYGGWAQAWGATICPYTNDELKLLNIPASEFQESMNEILNLLRLPLGPTSELRFTTPFIRSLCDLPSVEGYKVIPSWLAISEFSNDISKGCAQCGLCLDGCPEDHIWNPAKFWDSAIPDGPITYRGGLWVENFHSTKRGVTLTLLDGTGQRLTEDFDYVFCALGSIQSAALLIRSKITTEVSVHDSQIFLVPFISKKLKNTSASRERVSLSEAFLINESPNNSSENVFFAQIYGHSKSLENQILAQNRYLRMMPRKLFSLITRHIGIAMCFVHQNRSGYIRLNSTGSKVSVKSQKSRINRRANLKMIAGILSKFHLYALKFAVPDNSVGESYHLGALSFKIADENLTDVWNHLGQIPNLQHVSFVDSSVLTQVISKPLSFNVLVNSRRIGSEVIRNLGKQT
jgi:ferredoxin